MFRNWFFWSVMLIIMLGVGFIIFQSNKPKEDNKAAQNLPGETFPDLGRSHTEDIYGIIYNSNPPTSGTHFPVWAKKGVYNRVISDGYLIHSLEHGYIVVSYNCDNVMLNGQLPMSNVFSFPKAYAHKEETVEATNSGVPLMHMDIELGANMSYFTPKNAPEKEVELTEGFNTPKCKDLVDTLSRFIEPYQRALVVPRINMETIIALTAWTKMLRMDTWDGPKAKEFADKFENKGPEKTIE